MKGLRNTGEKIFQQTKDSKKDIPAFDDKLRICDNILLDFSVPPVAITIQPKMSWFVNPQCYLSKPANAHFPEGEYNDT